MKYVEILKLENDGSQRVGATCSLGDDGVVKFAGDEDLVQSLQEGIFNYDKKNPQTLYAKDGLAFLESLPKNFHSGYFNATDIKETE